MKKSGLTGSHISGENIDNWIRILVATAFNLLFEYSMRGLNDLAARPFLPLFLFLVYFPYFTLLEHLIEKYRFRDWQVLLSGFVFGSLAAFFIPGAMFSPPLLLGINWLSYFFITVVWWGNLQGVLTFYLARRVVPERRYIQFITRTGLGIMLALLVAMLFIFRFAIRTAPPITAPGALMILLLASLAALVLYKTRMQSDKRSVSPSPVMDALVIITVGLFAITALFFRDKDVLGIHQVNLTAVVVVVIWSIIAFLITWAYRIGRGKEILV